MAGSVHWVFDLDGTLVDGLSATSLRPGAAELLERLVGSGARVSLWSAGGADYARRVTERAGIAGWFGAVADKEVGADGRWELPAGWDAHAAVVCVDDDPERLPLGVRAVAVRPFLGATHDDALSAIDVPAGC
jgi:phosphoserine phosphatase